ncbi:glycosyltransferase N-terminal domain-containing protein [Terriglobus sp. TAA 43]|uniref:3-deoxy-D-manno-octulosonic acid transferase n=1 Tax=Terriglobus sp. TAA 43 TaxID=278961 RepID=UPI000646E6C1
MMMLLYSLGLTLALVLTAPVWGWRMLRQGRYREGLRARLGDVPARLTAFVAGRPVVWVHCVSVGETLAAVRLIAELEAALPEYAVVVSTTTPTGQRVARERFGADRVFFFPLDFAFAVRPYLRVLQPKLLVLMESELWPRVLVECERAQVPVAVVNARVSDRSLPRYMRLRMLWKPLLEKVSLLLAQSDEDVRRWRLIGAPESVVRSSGNLKFDIRVAEETPLTRLVRQHLPAAAKVLVCGSTHDGEESLLLDCWKTLTVAERVMVLAPRHPERSGAVEQLIVEHGLQAIRLTAWRMEPSPILGGAVLLVDTVGELSSLYALASVAFVGGSLIPHGGQNPLEPARLGVPVVMGGSYANFRGMVDAMQRDNAIRMVTRESLCGAIDELMTHGDDGLGERGRLFAASMIGATERTVAALLSLVQERAS